jgi:hypothetical protein
VEWKEVNRGGGCPGFIMHGWALIQEGQGKNSLAEIHQGLAD